MILIVSLCVKHLINHCLLSVVIVADFGLLLTCCCSLLLCSLVHCFNLIYLLVLIVVILLDLDYYLLLLGLHRVYLNDFWNLFRLLYFFRNIILVELIITFVLPYCSFLFEVCPNILYCTFSKSFVIIVKMIENCIITGFILQSM